MQKPPSRSNENAAQIQQALRELMQDRKLAYCHVFGGESPGMTAVMHDLEKFCRTNESTFHVEQRVHALLEGRREVMLRIKDYLLLSVDELCAKYGRKDYA